MSQAVLYSFRRCPYAMRARMALHVSGLNYEHREVLLRDKPKTMLEASPKGTVPVFITEDSQVIDESLDVVFFALQHNDPENWLENYDSTLVEQIDGPFKHHLDRYKYASRYKDNAKRGEVDHSHRKAAEKTLVILESHLNETPFLSGKKQSLTDIVIFPFIRQFAAVELDWFSQRFPALQNWLTYHVESPLFKTIMVKHKLWQAEVKA